MVDARHPEERGRPLQVTKLIGLDGRAIVEQDVGGGGGIDTDRVIRGHTLLGPGMSLGCKMFLEATARKGAKAAAAAAPLGPRALVAPVGSDAIASRIRDWKETRGLPRSCAALATLLLG